MKEYQTIQRSIIIDLQKLSDHNLLLSSDIKATEYLQERYNHLKILHLNLEQKSNHLQVCILQEMFCSDKHFSVFFLRNALMFHYQLMIKLMIVFNK